MEMQRDDKHPTLAVSCRALAQNWEGGMQRLRAYVYIFIELVKIWKCIKIC